jgi:hypothetical protein
LELLFLAKAPVPVHLQLERLGSMKIVDFRMEKVEGIARQMASASSMANSCHYGRAINICTAS